MRKLSAEYVQNLIGEARLCHSDQAVDLISAQNDLGEFFGKEPDMGFKFISAALLFAGIATSANATSISFSSFDVSTYNAALAASGPVITEDFEGFLEGNVNDGVSTAVGTFATLGGTGSGGTVTNADASAFGNDGSKLAIRDGYVFGRTSTTALLNSDKSLDKFLDSNDTFGIKWTADLGGTMFDRLVLTLSDAADVGAIMQVTGGGATQSFSTAGDGNRKVVVIEFASAVSSAVIDFANIGSNGLLTNDGFSLDDIAVSTVPVPAGLLLMGTALAGLGMVRRRKQA